MSDTPVRNIRIEDDLWARIAETAAQNGESASAYIRRVVIRALKEES